MFRYIFITNNAVFIAPICKLCSSCYIYVFGMKLPIMGKVHMIYYDFSDTSLFSFAIVSTWLVAPAHSKWRIILGWHMVNTRFPILVVLHWISTHAYMDAGRKKHENYDEWGQEITHVPQVYCSADSLAMNLIPQSISRAHMTQPNRSQDSLLWFRSSDLAF